MRATILNCTLKPARETSNTEALAGIVARRWRGTASRSRWFRVLDYDVRPGVTSDESGGDEWPPAPRQDPRLGDPRAHADLARGISSVAKRACSSDSTRCSRRPATTGRTAAQTLVAVARALAADPIPAP